MSNTVRIRRELFKLSYLKNEFVLNSKADAFEAFDDILSYIHCWLTAQNHAKAASANVPIGSESDYISKLKDMRCDSGGEPCFVHKMFFVKHI